LPDARASARVTHGVGDLVAQRVFPIACGQPDGNDGDRLADDPIHKLGLIRLCIDPHSWIKPTRASSSDAPATRATPPSPSRASVPGNEEESNVLNSDRGAWSEFLQKFR